MNQITVTGMVLKQAPFGEYDKRVEILTKERGKISAFARGARKPNSALAGAVSPFSFGEFTLYEGRSSYTLQSASISNYFAELRQDMEGACYAFYIMDVCAYYGKEGNDETELLKLLYQTLRTLCSRRISNRLIRYIFELKAVSINGEGPQVFGCIGCGATEDFSVFSVRRGGIVCRACALEIRDGIRLLGSTLYALQYIVSTPVERLYTFAVSAEVLEELGTIAGRYLEHYLDKQFKSLEILEQLTGV